MREIKFDEAMLEDFFRQAEVTRVLTLAGAEGVWSHTQAEGILDGVRFRLHQSKDRFEASFVLSLNREITTYLEQEEHISQRLFNLRFNDLFDALSATVKNMGYLETRMEFGHDVRFCLEIYDRNGLSPLNPTTALEKMRTDAPKIRQLFDAMNNTALAQITKERTGSAAP
jgi:DNA polymerase/3'-5' exonuclease PolX